jgi:hypothetical protein
MRRLLAAILFCLGILCISQSDAFYQSRDSNYNISIPSGGGGSVTVDQVNSAGQDFVLGGGTTATFTNLTGVTAGAAVVVGFDINSASNISSVTDNLVAMTQIGTSLGGTPNLVFYGLTNASAGSQSIVVTLSATSQRVSIGAMSFKGACNCVQEFQ